MEQVYLRCSQGFLEWLYPTGAIIVNLRPNTVSTARLSVCIKPSGESSGTNIYLDRAGKLRLLLREQDQARGHKVHCFGIREGALFIEAIPRTDISRRITTFQYELVSERAGPHALDPLTGESSPWWWQLELRFLRPLLNTFVFIFVICIFFQSVTRSPPDFCLDRFPYFF